jgi:hypothetical protein
MLDKKALDAFRKWGALGGKTRAKRYSPEQIAGMAKRGWKTHRQRLAKSKAVR